MVLVDHKAKFTDSGDELCLQSQVKIVRDPLLGRFNPQDPFSLAEVRFVTGSHCMLRCNQRHPDESDTDFGRQPMTEPEFAELVQIFQKTADHESDTARVLPLTGCRLLLCSLVNRSPFLHHLQLCFRHQH